MEYILSVLLDAVIKHGFEIFLCLVLIAILITIFWTTDAFHKEDNHTPSKYQYPTRTR